MQTVPIRDRLELCEGDAGADGRDRLVGRAAGGAPRRAGEPRLSGRTAGPSTSPDQATGWPTARRARSIRQARLRLLMSLARAKDPFGFADYSIGHTLGFGRDYGLGNMQATLGVRMAEPLASNGFTPALDPRRYLGVGPRVGLEGNQPLQSSWAVEWQVGAAILFGNRIFDTSARRPPVLPNYSSSGSVVNVDGLLGLSYWFDTASKLTLGYRADYFKGSPAFSLTGAAGGQHRPPRPRADGPLQHPEVEMAAALFVRRRAPRHGGSAHDVMSLVSHYDEVVVGSDSPQQAPAPCATNFALRMPTSAAPDRPRSDRSSYAFLIESASQAA